MPPPSPQKEADKRGQRVEQRGRHRDAIGPVGGAARVDGFDGLLQPS
jgi:hypothetical protein